MAAEFHVQLAMRLRRCQCSLAMLPH
eukprot:COSAG01_NODE_11548_length_1905_cov_191.848283_3_plen_25_part_01